MWRINLGRNIRAGAHYTQFMVYDLDGDGKAEIAMKTADGTTDGKDTSSAMSMPILEMNRAESCPVRNI